MVELSQLYGGLRAQDESLYIRDLGCSVAACAEYHHKYAVFLDSACFQSLRRMKSILAHEIGHCATGCTHRVSSPLDLVEKHEYKATRWAIERYLPFAALQEAMAEGFCQPWELAEYFDVSEQLVRQALQYYTGPKALRFQG